MNLHTFVEYFVQVGSTLILPIVLMPTDEQMQQLRKAHYQIGNVEIGTVTKAWWDRNMVYNQVNMKEGRWWTTLTHSFIHLNDAHKYGNLFYLFPSSVHVFSHFGIGGVLFLFHGSSLLVLSKTFKHLSAAEFEEKLYYRTSMGLMKSDSYQVGGIGQAMAKAQGGVASWWNAGARKVAKIVSPNVLSISSHLGASQGVFALVGAGFTIGVVESIQLIYELVWGRRMGANFSKSKRRKRRTSQILLELACELSMLDFNFRMGTSEAVATFSGQGELSISSSAHTTGFAFGVVTCSALLVARACYRKFVKGSVLY